MPQLRYDVNFERSEASMSSSDLIRRYFFGIPLFDANGNTMSTQQIERHINSAKEQLEGYLDLKLGKQIITENVSFIRQEWLNWGYIPTSFPVLSVISLDGYVGSYREIQYPHEWLSIKESTDNSAPHRQVHLVPTGGNIEGTSVLYSGISPHIGWFGSKTVPNYWQITYCTSFNQVPEDIIDVMGKLASINIFNQMGDIALGQAGLASTSISIDGLSQSVGTTNSATNAAFGARIINYQKEIKTALPDLKSKYKGIGFIVV